MGSGIVAKTLLVIVVQICSTLTILHLAIGKVNRVMLYLQKFGIYTEVE
jgi:hypothetical protein